MAILEDRPTLAKGYVYGIQCAPFIKIGVAKDVAQRLSLNDASTEHPARN
jgi:hypothetical protein